MLSYEGRDPQFVFAPRRHLGVSHIIFLRVFCVLSVEKRASGPQGPF